MCQATKTARHHDELTSAARVDVNRLLVPCRSQGMACFVGRADVYYLIEAKHTFSGRLDMYRFR